MNITNEIMPEKIFQNFEKIIKKINKTSIWSKIMLISLVLIVYYIINKPKNNIEGFEQQDKLIFKENGEIYDTFYTSIYDQLKNDTKKTEFEISSIINNTSINNNDNILDIGSGTGNHVGGFKKYNINAIGLDKSKDMINISKKNFPNCKFKLGNVVNNNLFQPHNFSLISMMNLTIYELNNKKAAIKNCYEWLKPGGFLILHLVNPNKFNPSLKVSDPLNILENSSLDNKDNKNTFIKFKNFTYKKIFNFINNIATFKETFKDNDNKTRINTLELRMESIAEIVNVVKNEGFIQDSVVDLYKINYPDQFLFSFYKPE
tara:strand:- start:7430 stop:8383 length:954 start_codon:yes stop_codon:yes gene_type:complete